MWRYLIFIGFVLLIFGCHRAIQQGTPEQNHQQYLEKYKHEFLTDTRSPLSKNDLINLDFFEFDGSWQLICTCTEPTSSKVFEMDLYSGKQRPYKVFKVLHCARLQQKFTLELYKSMVQPSNPLYEHYLFLPFKDITNGDMTYGGGRYIDIKDFDIVGDSVLIDFNRAYNPWCAYSSGYNCPVPPKANHLDFEVKVGEKAYKGSYKDHK
ncbi:MAG: DUF1684 domain-containing protein [Saprospiraceae bacterium]